MISNSHGKLDYLFETIIYVTYLGISGEYCYKIVLLQDHYISKLQLIGYLSMTKLVLLYKTIFDSLLEVYKALVCILVFDNALAINDLLLFLYYEVQSCKLKFYSNFIYVFL